MKQKLIEVLKRYQEAVKPYNAEKVKTIDGWILEVNEHKVTSYDFCQWLDYQESYEREKDREYAEYLYQLGKTFK